MWADPSAVSLMWLSMFFSILCLSLRLQTLILTAELNDYDVVEAHQRMQTYQERATQALVLGRFTLCAPGTVEALLFYNYMEYFAAADPSIGGWSFFAMTVRLAMRAGYHRDACSYPEIKPFEAEMRRRVWSLMRQMVCTDFFTEMCLQDNTLGRIAPESFPGTTPFFCQPFMLVLSLLTTLRTS